MTEQAQAPNAPEGGATATQAEPAQATPSEERTFTQADLKKIAATEKREGKQAAINELLQKTEAESIDDILSVYEAHKLTQAEMETAADKAEKAREKAEAQRQAAEERYTNTLREFALRDALRDSGINPERLKGAMRLADMSSLEVDKEGNVSGLEEVVQAVQEESPEWFGQTERPKVNAPQTTGTGLQRPGASADPQLEHGRFLANLLNGP